MFSKHIIKIGTPAEKYASTRCRWSQLSIRLANIFPARSRHMTSWFDISNASGLTEQEAAERLREEGYNDIPSTKRRSILAIAFELVRQPMFLLLVGGGVIYLLLGDVREALMLLGFVIVVMGITFYQERKTERALEAWRDLSSPRGLAIRDGQEKRIRSEERR